MFGKPRDKKLKDAYSDEPEYIECGQCYKETKEHDIGTCDECEEDLCMKCLPSGQTVCKDCRESGEWSVEIETSTEEYEIVSNVNRDIAEAKYLEVTESLIERGYYEIGDGDDRTFILRDGVQNVSINGE